MEDRSGLVFAAVLVAALVIIGSAQALSGSGAAPQRPWAVVRSGLVLEGPPAVVPCVDLGVPKCPAPSDATLSPVALISYGPGRYYVYNETSQYGRINGTTLYTTYSVWFTNESVYCVTPAYAVSNSFIRYPTCPASPYREPSYLLPSSGASAYSPALGLSLNLTLTAAPGGGVEVTAFDFNLRGQENTVQPASLWKIATRNFGSPGGCGSLLPAGFAVYAGDYGPSDLPRQSALRISGYSELFCPYFLPVSQYVFEAQSDVALAVDGAGNYAGGMSSTLVASGYWSGGNPYTLGGPCPPAALYPACPPLVFSQFPPGMYTVVAADEWGQIAVLHFAVTGA
ncbi:MAG: hypothetical protein JRN21_04330 [Nitrososphaerota archaeon]|nr:hypothetical protein [Nitrososphaerota archaeon]